MSRAVKTPVATVVFQRTFRAVFYLLLCAASAFPQKNAPAPALKYDSQTETKTKGTIDEIKVITVGARNDYTAVIVRNGDNRVEVYLSPKPFQDEMGINFNKGDEIAVTGSKVKLQDADVILAREVVKGNDTLLFRDPKGMPIWNERTGK